MKTDTQRARPRATWGDVFPKSRIGILDNGEIKKIRIEGARKLLLCIEKEVKIALKTEVFHCFGNHLACVSYASGAVEVTGEIREIRFENRKIACEENV